MQEKKIVALCGPPSYLISPVADRLAHLQHYTPLSVSNLLEAEIQAKLGELALKHKAKAKQLPTKLLVDRLIEEISKLSQNRILLVGFPRSLQQATYFQGCGYSLNKIISLEDEEVECLRLISQKHPDLPAQQIYQKYRQSFGGLSELYKKYGVYRTIKIKPDIDQVYQSISKALKPNVVFLYGPPCAGQQQLAQSFTKVTGWTHISFESLRVASERDCVGLMNRLSKKISESCSTNFVVDGFFEQARQVNLFFDRVLVPLKVFQINLPSDQIDARINKLTPDKKRDSHLANFQKFNLERESIRSLLAAKGLLVSLQEASASKAIQKMRSRVILCEAFSNDDNIRVFLNNLEEREFVSVRLQDLQHFEIDRKSRIGYQITPFVYSNKPIPVRYQLQLLRRCLFSNLSDTIVIEQINNHSDFLKQFFEPDLYLEFEFKPETRFFSKPALSLDYLEKGKLIYVTQNNVNSFISKLERPLKYGFVLGSGLTGKTTLSKELSKNCKFGLVQWQSAINSIKQQLSTPENPIEDLPLPKLFDYYSKQLKGAQTQVVFDGFPYPQGEFWNWIAKVGPPAFVIELRASDQSLLKRMRGEGDPSVQINEEEKGKLDQINKKAVAISAMLKELQDKFRNCRVLSVDTTPGKSHTEKISVGFFRRRIRAVHVDGEFGAQLSRFFRTIALNLKYAFVDVKNEIQNHLESKDSPFRQTLKTQLAMRWTMTEESLPSNFNPDTVAKIIKFRVEQNCEHSGDVILFGYPSADIQVRNKIESENQFPRVSDEIKALQSNIGPIESLFMIARKHRSLKPSPKKIRLTKPQKDKPVAKEGQEVPPPPAEDDDKKNKYSVYDYEWSVQTSSAIRGGEFFELKQGVEGERVKLGLERKGVAWAQEKLSLGRRGVVWAQM